MLLARFLGVAADETQIRHERGRGEDPFSLDDLMRAARRLDLMAKARSARVEDLAKIPVPANTTAVGRRRRVLLKADDQPNGCRFLIQQPQTPRPEILQQSELAAAFAGFVLLMTSREQVAGVSRNFDVSWFIPAMVKYRRPLHDVIVASFFLRLAARPHPGPR